MYIYVYTYIHINIYIYILHLDVTQQFGGDDSVHVEQALLLLELRQLRDGRLQRLGRRAQVRGLEGPP